MKRSALRSLPAVFAVLLAFAGRAQAPAASATSAAPATAPPKVAILGASVSAGFRDGPATGGSQDNDTVPLQRVVKAWYADVEGVVKSRANLMMFTDPETIGRHQVEQTRKDPPDLLLAVDFLFWYGYGRVEIGKDGELAAREARFRKGLEELAGFTCPIVVGDLPDMTGAAPRMLSPSQIPALDMQKAMNAQLQAFAKEHANVCVFPLAALVQAMKVQGVSLPLQGGALATPPGGLLQGDRLHATRLGMAWLGFRLQQAITAMKPANALLTRTQWTFEQFVAAAGAEGELEALRGKGGGTKAPATPAKAPAGGGK